MGHHSFIPSLIHLFTFCILVWRLDQTGHVEVRNPVWDGRNFIKSLIKSHAIHTLLHIHLSAPDRHTYMGFIHKFGGTQLYKMSKISYHWKFQHDNDDDPAHKAGLAPRVE